MHWHAFFLLFLKQHKKYNSFHVLFIGVKSTFLRSFLYLKIKVYSYIILAFSHVFLFKWIFYSIPSCNCAMCAFTNHFFVELVFSVFFFKIIMEKVFLAALLCWLHGFCILFYVAILFFANSTLHLTIRTQSIPLFMQIHKTKWIFSPFLCYLIYNSKLHVKCNWLRKHFNTGKYFLRFLDEKWLVHRIRWKSVLERIYIETKKPS